MIDWCYWTTTSRQDLTCPWLSHSSFVKSHKRKSLSSSQVLNISSWGITSSSLFSNLKNRGMGTEPVWAHLLGSPRARKDGGAGSAVLGFSGFLALSVDQKLVLYWVRPMSVELEAALFVMFTTSAFKPVDSWIRKTVFKDCKLKHNFRWPSITKRKMPDSQRYPRKLCLIKYELLIRVYNLENWLFSIVVNLQKWLAHFYYMKKVQKWTEFETFKTRKTTSSTLLFR